ncbi:SsgA family sporulation/cell division regulator [Streptomyces sp. NPDC058295]|uniref:SsgA family sporulation/cell division regulator n=1 Tax=Streptomyces sp. NPDC058295 TaxID=3346431 RepID=UPI0036E9B3DD
MHHPTDPTNGCRFVREPEVLRRTLSIRVLLSADEAVRLRVCFVHDPADPLVVRMEFPGSPEDIVPWMFSRDLLYAGLRVPSGEGDVRVWPPCPCHGLGSVRILLRSSFAAAVLFVPADPLRDWLDETFASVPAGEESARMSWEGPLERLLYPG